MLNIFYFRHREEQCKNLALWRKRVQKPQQNGNVKRPEASRELFYFWAFAEIHSPNCHTWWNNAIWHAPNTR